MADWLIKIQSIGIDDEIQLQSAFCICLFRIHRLNQPPIDFRFSIFDLQLVKSADAEPTI